MGQSLTNSTRTVSAVWWPLSFFALLALMGSGWLIEAAAFTPSSQWLWLMDLAVGWTFLVCGWIAALPGRRPAAGALLAATGVAWFIGTLVPDLALLHRGPLVHLLVTYPGWRPHGRFGWILIMLGYAAALLPVLGRSSVLTVVLAMILVAYLMLALRGASALARRTRAIALGCGIALVFALVAAIIVANRAEALSAADLVAYSVVLMAIAVALTAGLGWRRAGIVTDLVVQLGDSPAPVLRDQLAHALRDPTLEVGYWSPATLDYRDDAGRAVPQPGRVDPGVITLVPRDGREFAVVVHDATTMIDDDVTAEIAAAVRLGDRNDDLRADVAAQLRRLAVSRDHLDNTFVEESQRLESRLASGPVAHLDRIRARLAQLPPAEWSDDPHIARALEHLSLASVELAALAHGLHGRSMSESGLQASLEQLAARSTITVTVDAPTDPLPSEVEATVWFVCAEALANVEKHAHARCAAVAVIVTDGVLTLTMDDDGQGGADLAAGTGLRGLQDRVQAAAGTLALRSEKGQGTQIRVTLPLAASDQPASPMRTHG